MPRRPRRAPRPRRSPRTRPGRLIALVHREGSATVFRIAKRLESPNTWRFHWSLGHRQMRQWTRAFETALSVKSVVASQIPFADTGPRKFRMRVSVTRQVPRLRNFIRDADDLRYTTKPLNDGLKQAGLIYDDSERWLEQPCPTQEVSPDGLFWTIVRVEPAAPLEART